MENVGTRIAKVIKSTGLTQVDFAKRVNLSQGHISGITRGTQRPSDRTISDICREFGVNEVWLRTGQGEMAQAMTRKERIASFVGEALQDESDSYRLLLIDALAALTPKEWEVLAGIAKRVAESRKEKKDQADAQSLQGESPED